MSFAGDNPPSSPNSNQLEPTAQNNSLLGGDYYPQLGADCHQRSQGQFAVAVLTDLFGNILFSNVPSKNNQWVIRSGRPTVTRFWSASTLFITCVANLPSTSSDIPPLPNALHLKGAADSDQTEGESEEEQDENEPQPISNDQAQPDLEESLDELIDVFAEEQGWILSTDEDSQNDAPSETIERESDYPAGDYFESPLDIGDEVCFYIGYINELRPVFQKDIDENRLLRTFVGTIDTISASQSKNGIILNIQCRDRMKYLMDSLVTYNSSEDFTETIGLQDGEDGDNAPKNSRSDVILQVARRSVGQITASSGDQPVCSSLTCGMRVDKGVIYDIENMFEQGAFTGIRPNIFYQPSYVYTARWNEQTQITAPGKGQVVRPNRRLVPRERQYPSSERLNPSDIREKVDVPSDERASTIAVSEKEVNGIGSSVTNYPRPSYFPKFNIATGRAGYPDEKFGRNFSLVDRVPLEYIKYLASQEIYPTEVFQDHRSGDFYYSPRANDTSGLYDPQRFYRTYYFRCAPAGHTPDKAQMLLSYREERSIVNFRSNIIVSNVETGPGGAQNSEAINIHLKIIPSWLQGKKYACTFYNFVDPTIKSTAEAAIIATQVARTMSKETRAAVAVMVGDPSIVPGEIVQILGSALYPQGLDPELAKKEVDEFVEYNELYNQTYVDYQQIIHDTSDGNAGNVDEFSVAGADPINITNQADKDNSALMCGDDASKLQFQTEPRTIWRVEAVIHHFNEGDSVFTTEVALISPF